MNTSVLLEPSSQSSGPLRKFSISTSTAANLMSGHLAFWCGKFLQKGECLLKISQICKLWKPFLKASGCTALAWHQCPSMKSCTTAGMRNLKAALRLLSCCGFSLRLQKLGDLSGMPTQKIVSPDCLNRKSCVGHWWWISSFRVAASWKHYQDRRLPKCFIKFKNILTTDFLHVWEGLLNSSFFMPYLWKWDKWSIAFIRIAPRTPEGAWKRDSLRVEGIYFLKRSDTLYFSQPCTEDENKFCQVMD